MKIALITPGFSLNLDDWAIPALQTLACGLAQSAEVHVFSLRYPAAGLYQLGSITHHAIGGGQRFGLASPGIWQATVRAIVTEHRRTPFDVLHAFWIDEPGFTALMAASLLRRPVVASVGGGELTWLPDINYGTQGSRLRRRLVRHTLKHARVITAGSPYQCDLCRRYGASQERLRLAPLGVDCDRFRPGPLPAWDRPTLVQAASLSGVKNQALLLEVLHDVKKTIPAIRLILAGSGVLENQLRKCAQNLDLDQNIVWQQGVPHPEMAQVYQRAHLYLQTSRHESQGIAVLEAMACGLPVLGTPVGLARDLVCLPTQQSAGVLASQVIGLLSDTEHYLANRQQAREVVERSFCLPLTTDHFRQIYEEASR